MISAFFNKVKELFFSESISTAVLGFGVYFLSLKFYPNEVSNFIVGWALSSILLSSIGSVFINLSRFRLDLRLYIFVLLIIILSITYAVYIEASLVFVLFGISQSLKKLFYVKNGYGYLSLVSMTNYFQLFVYLLMAFKAVDIYAALFFLGVIGVVLLLGFRIYIETSERLVNKPGNVINDALVLSGNSFLVAFFFQGQVLLVNYLGWEEGSVVGLSVVVTCLNVFVTLSSHEINSKYLRLLSLVDGSSEAAGVSIAKYARLFLLLLPVMVTLWLILVVDINVVNILNLFFGLCFVIVFVLYMDSNLIFRVYEKYKIPLAINFVSVAFMCFIFLILNYFKYEMALGSLLSVALALYLSIKYKRSMFGKC